MVNLVFAIFGLFLVHQSTGNNGPYYGVPVGSLYNAESNTQGEVYASDPRTVSVVHFHHNAEAGCTSFMVGPPKNDRLSSVNREGISLVVKSQRHVRVNRAAGSVARQPLVPQIAANNPNFHPFDWPFELAHLRVDESAKSLDSQPKSKVQDPFNVELDDEKEEHNFTVPEVTADPETTFNYISASSDQIATRIRTMHGLNEEVTEASKPEVLNQTQLPAAPNAASNFQTIQISKLMQELKHSSSGAQSQESSTSSSSAPISSSPSEQPTSSSASVSTASSAAPLSGQSTSATSASAPSQTTGQQVFNGFIEELSVDDLDKPTQKWTVPPNIPVDKLPVLTKGKSNSVVLHSKNSIIIEGANETLASQPRLIVANNGSISMHDLPNTHAPGNSSAEEADEESGSKAQTTVDYYGSGDDYYSVPVELSVTRENSGDEYEDETTETVKVTESPKPDANGQKIFVRGGSTTENPNTTISQSTAKPVSTSPSSATTKESKRAKAERERAEVRRKELQEESQRRQAEKGGSDEKKEKPAGGIQWQDHTRSPSARQRETDIRQSSQDAHRSIYDPPSRNSPPSGSASQGNGGVSWNAGGKAGGNGQSKFWGPLPREATEWFGGLNIPDDIEGKVPGATFEPVITRRGRPGVQYTGEGVTFSFGFGSAAEQAGGPVERPSPPPRSERRFASSSSGFVSSSSSSSDINVGNPPSARGEGEPPAGPAPPSAGLDPEAEIRARVQAERHKAYLGITDPTASTSAHDTTSTTKSPLLPTTRDPNALFFEVENPHARRTRPPVVETPAPPSGGEGDGRWVVVEDRPSRRRQEAQKPAEPAPANLVLTKGGLELNQDSGKMVSDVSGEEGDMASKNINWSSSKHLAGQENFYALSKAQDDIVTLSLPQEYKFKDFKWFGIYDHCQKRVTSFVEIGDIETPDIIQIAGFNGVAKSGNIRIVNCNTLMITGLTYSGYGAADAHFYVGAGDPKTIVKKIRVPIVGPLRGDPLHNYNNEDVLIKLPNGLKTFDINWLAIINDNDNTSYGHVTIPPLIVPPCDDLY